VLMDVFVIPVGRDRYELYCEPSNGTTAGDDGHRTGLFGRMRDRFDALVHAAEEWQRQGEPEPNGRIARIKGRLFGWVAQRIVEQRLLWNLRNHTEVVAAHPQDMTFDQVLALIRGNLQEDYDRHRRWRVIDGVLFVVTFVALGPFFLLVPGVANIPAIYFGFRAIGHWLSMHGAAQGLQRVTWSGRACPPLSELRDVVLLEPPVRDARVHDVAARLRLPHLSTFFERVAVRHA
jgi:Mitochondrial K+-H+ exchange-related